MFSLPFVLISIKFTAKSLYYFAKKLVGLIWNTSWALLETG